MIRRLCYMPQDFDDALSGRGPYARPCSGRALPPPPTGSRLIAEAIAYGGTTAQGSLLGGRLPPPGRAGHSGRGRPRRIARRAGRRDERDRTTACRHCEGIGPTAPRPADVLLVIEVAETSVESD